MSIEYPLISVIIPIYNSEEYIKSTIESCLLQTYDNFELIVVNDGSKDNSGNIIKGFNDIRIRYFEIENNGPCYARNYGIDKARGELFQFLDADDILHKKKFERQVSQYLIHGKEYVYSGIMGSIAGDRKGLEQGFQFYYRNFNPEDYFRNMFGNFGKYYTTGIWLIPRHLVEKTSGWNVKVRINNDGEYISRIILFSKGIKFCSGAIFYYRKDVPNSISKSFNSKDIYKSWLYSYSCYVKHFQILLDHNAAIDLGRKALSVYYCNSYPHYPDLLEECKRQIIALGFPKPVPHGGRTFKLISALIGVDNALKLRTSKNIRNGQIKEIKA